MHTNCLLKAYQKLLHSLLQVPWLLIHNLFAASEHLVYSNKLLVPTGFLLLSLRVYCWFPTGSLLEVPTGFFTSFLLVDLLVSQLIPLLAPAGFLLVSYSFPTGFLLVSVLVCYWFPTCFPTDFPTDSLLVSYWLPTGFLLVSLLVPLLVSYWFPTVFPTGFPTGYTQVVLGALGQYKKSSGSTGEI